MKEITGQNTGIGPCTPESILDRCCQITNKAGWDVFVFFFLNHIFFLFVLRTWLWSRENVIFGEHSFWFSTCPEVLCSLAVNHQVGSPRRTVHKHEFWFTVPSLKGSSKSKSSSPPGESPPFYLNSHYNLNSLNGITSPMMIWIFSSHLGKMWLEQNCSFERNLGRARDKEFSDLMGNIVICVWRPLPVKFWLKDCFTRRFFGHSY